MTRTEPSTEQVGVSSRARNMSVSTISGVEALPGRPTPRTWEAGNDRCGGVPGGAGAAALEHLQKGDREVDVREVAKVKSERSEYTDGRGPQHAESRRDLDVAGVEAGCERHCRAHAGCWARTGQREALEERLTSGGADERKEHAKQRERHRELEAEHRYDPPASAWGCKVGEVRSCVDGKCITHLLSMMMPEEAAQNITALTMAASRWRSLHSMRARTTIELRALKAWRTPNLTEPNWN